MRVRGNQLKGEPRFITMSKRDYQRHIVEACKRDKEERAEVQNKIDSEIKYLQLESNRDMYRLKCDELGKQVAELEEWKAARVHLYKL